MLPHPCSCIPAPQLRSPLLSASNMRLDVFLKISRLVPRRTLAQEMCEGGKVKVNGLRAKSAREVREGDLLTISARGKLTTIKIAKVPAKPPSKRDAASLYETIESQQLERDLLV